MTHNVIEVSGGRPGAWTYEVLNEEAWSLLDPDERRAEQRRALRRRQNRRRAERLRSNGPRERFTLEQVGDRDGWICAICRTSASKTFRSPHPCSASVHHVIEVVEGGTDTLDNVVLAHRFCNSDSYTWGPCPPDEARAHLADRVLYGKHGPDRRKRIPEPAAIALAAEIMGVLCITPSTVALSAPALSWTASYSG